MADELAKKISELDNLPNGDMEGFYTIGSKDNAQGNPVSYKMNLVVLKNAIAAAAAAVANANDAVSAAQAAQAAFLDAIVQQTGQNTAKVMSQKAVTDALAAISDTITTLTGRIGDIRDVIPSAASASNQLADKAFVNSSIATATAEFRGTYDSLAELQAVSADENDYGYVRTTDAAGNTVFKRYKYASGSWVFEYDLNNSSFTASQWAAINSAITAELVEKLRALPTNAALTELLNGKQGVIADLDTIRANATAGGTAYQKPAGGIPKSDMSPEVQSSLGKADSAVQDVSGKADKTELEALAEEVAKKANVEGYYGGLTAGSAENLVGRGSVEAEIQGIRTSAGQEDIGTGAAIIREVRGKSLVWNQLANNSIFPNETRAGLLFGHDADGTITINGTASTIETISGWLGLSVNNPIPRSHKLYISRYLISGSVSGTWGFDYNPNRTTRGEQNEKFILNGSADNSKSIFWFHEGCVFTNAKIALNVIDLTLMFGAGSEPATIEEFERMFFLPYYEYNEGTIINNEATGLRTRGFNLYNPVTGKAVLPGKYSDYPYEYEICGTFTSISFEDYAGNVSTPELTDGRFFNVPSPGVLTVVGGNATDTCVHLVWSGWRNYGEPDYVFEPYWENTLQINIKTITGKLNGEGESVVIFPDGMRGVGPIYDRLIVDPDGFARRAVKRMKSVDLGTLNWGKKIKSSAGEYAYFFSDYFSSGKDRTTAFYGLCDKGYSYSNNYATGADKSIIMRTGNSGTRGNAICIRDLSYQDSTPEEFKSAMSGVELVYELATPLEYVLDEPIPMTYPVDDFGVEAKLPVDTAELPTGPLRFAVTYPFNAVDKLRRLSTNYLSKESTEEMLNALQSAGIIGGYTMTYNATTEHYTFTITAPSVTPDETTE